VRSVIEKARRHGWEIEDVFDDKVKLCALHCDIPPIYVDVEDGSIERRVKR
jgi:hypothetical protein